MEPAKEVYYRIKDKGCFLPITKENAFKRLVKSELVFSSYEFKTNPNCQIITLEELKVVAPGPGIAIISSEEISKPWCKLATPEQVIKYVEINELDLAPISRYGQGIFTGLSSACCTFAPFDQDFIVAKENKLTRPLTKEEAKLKRQETEAQTTLTLVSSFISSVEKAVGAGSDHVFFSRWNDKLAPVLQSAIKELYPYIKLTPVPKNPDKVETQVINLEFLDQ